MAMIMISGSLQFGLAPAVRAATGAVAISPLQVSLAAGSSQAFTATATGTSAPEVTWSIASGPGSITSAGQYTAPSAFQGSRATVKATSVSDPSVFGYAQVSLSSGLGAVSVGQPTTSFPSQAPDLDTLDVNEDGRPDIVWVESRGSGGTLRIAANLPSGYVTLPSIGLSSAGRTFTDLVTGDFNGDGHDDIVAGFAFGSSPPGGLILLVGNGTGGFTQNPIITGQNKRSMRAADLNMDGRLDIAATTGSSVVALINDGTSGFNESVAFSAADTLYLDVADINGDGRPDIAATGDNAFFPQNRMRFGFGLPTGAFSVSETVVDSNPSSVLTTDMTGDGWPDVLFSAANKIWLLRNSADGTGAVGTRTEVASLGVNVTGLRSAHMDGDVFPDLVGVGHAIALMRGNGDGTFSSARWTSADLASSHGPIAEPVDMDGDGLLDIVSGGGSNFSKVRVFPGISSTAFAFGIEPSAADVNLTRTRRLVSFVTNSAQTPSRTYSASAGSVPTSGISDDVYVAPTAMPASGPHQTVTATLTSAPSPRPVATAAINLTDITFQLAGISTAARDVEFDPTDAERIYVATDLAIKYSDNGGLTFRTLGSAGLPSGVQTQEIEHVTDTVSGRPWLLAGTSSGVFRYDLAEGVTATWTDSNAGLSKGSSIAEAGATIFSAGNRGVFMSTDSGRNWTQIRSGGHQYVWANDPSNVYASDGSGGLFYSSDSGGTWVARRTGLASDTFPTSLTFDPSDPLTIYLTDGSPGAPGTYKTVDGGATWRTMDALPLERAFDIAFDPSEPSTMYAVGLDSTADSSVWKSVDSGASWWDIGRGLSDSQYLYTVAVSPFGGYAFAGTNDGIQPSTNGLFATGFPSTRVGPVPSVLVTPLTASVALGGTRAFSATVSGVSNTSVTWAVIDGPGSIDASGVYSAPAASRRPTAVIRATSIEDPEFSGTAQVNLIPRSGTGSFDYPSFRASTKGVIAFGDLNRDGHPDLMWVEQSYGSGPLHVAIGSAAGPTEQPAIGLTSNGSVTGVPTGLLTADFNGDGHLDLAVTFGFGGPGGSQGGVKILHGDGSGGLALQGFLPGFSKESPVAADFNGDGWMDIAARSRDDLLVLRNDGAGGFAEARVFNAPGASGITVGDFNADGRTDLLVGTRNTGFTVTDKVYLGLAQANGIFSVTPSAVATDPFSVVSADFDSDSDVDAVVAGAGKLWLLRNVGSGVFAPKVDLGSIGDSFNAASMIATHLNGDAYLDLVMNGSLSVGSMLGNGDGTFSTQRWTSMELGAHHSGLAVADFDSDGRMDVATGGGGNFSRVSIYPGSSSTAFDFSITPAAAHVNLGRNLRFPTRVRNAQQPPTRSYAASAGSVPSSGGSTDDRFVAPTVMPASGPIHFVTATLTSAPSPRPQAVATVTLTAITFRPAGHSSHARDVGFAPDDVERIYLAANTVRFSDDGGGSFRDLGTGLPTTGPFGFGAFESYQVRLTTDTATDRPFLLATSNTGLYRYDLSNGVTGTWSAAVPGVPGNPYDHALDSQGSRVMVGGNGLRLSTDGGSSFSTLRTGVIDEVTMVDASRVWIAESQAPWYSTDGGSTFIPKNGGLPSVFIRDIEVDPSDPSHVMLASATRGKPAYFTRDGGNSWLPVDLPVLEVSDFDFDPSRPNIVYAIALDLEFDSSVWKSVDGGVSWWDIGSGLSQSQYMDTVAVSPAGSEFVFAGTDDDIAPSTNGLFTTGFPRSSGLASPAIALTPSSVSLGLGQTAAFSVTVTGLTDPSVQWSVVDGPGSISSSGVYTAPSTFRGTTARVKARSVEDPAVSGYANISLASGVGSGALALPVTTFGSKAVAMQTSDLNGDGLPDLSWMSYQGPIHVALNSPTGLHEAAPISISFSGYPQDFVTGDFDADGRQDLLVMFTNSSGNSGSYQLMLGNGDGTFRAGASVAGLPKADAVAGDFNSDGNLDAAAASNQSVALLLGDGLGGFNEVRSFDATDVKGIAAADLNADGRLDIVAGTYGSFFPASNIHVAIAQPGGGFEVSAMVVGDYPSYPTLADLTSDGSPDIVVSAAGKSWLMRGNGDGTFAPKVQIGTQPGSYLMHFAAAHMDSDANLDLVASTNTSLMVMAGNGDGTFAPQRWYSADLGAFSDVMAPPADFDSDGRIDVATGGSGSASKVAVYPGATDTAFSFTVGPPDSRVNLTRRSSFAARLVNGTSFPTVSYSASTGSIDGQGQYVAPSSIASSGPTHRITATLTSSPLPRPTATASFQLTDINFQAAGTTSHSRDVAFDPNDVERIYVASNGVRYSDDGGITFANLGTGLPTTGPLGFGVFEAYRVELTVDPASGHNILMATGNTGLYRYDLSLGTTASWTQVAGIPGFPGDYPIDASGSTVMLGGGSLRRSTDGGRTFSVLRSGQVDEITMIDANELWFSVGSQLYRSSDGGATATLRSSGIPSSAYIDDIAVDPSDPSHVLVGSGTNATGAYETFDSGATFSMLQGLPLQRAHDLTFDPTDPAIVYAVGLDIFNGSAVWKSIDGGASWWDIGRGLSQSQYFDNVNVNPGTGRFVFAGTDDDIQPHLNGLFTTGFPVANSAPAVGDVAATVGHLSTAGVSVTPTASDADADPLTLFIVTPPARGTASISGSSIRYIPSGDAPGDVTFTYRASDGTASSNLGTARITLTDAAPAGTVTLSDAAPKTSDVLVAGVDASDPDGDGLSYRFTWTVGGFPIRVVETASPADSLDLSRPGLGDKGEIIRLDVAVSDGHSSINLAAVQAVVANSTPSVVATSASIGHRDPVGAVLSPLPRDPDGDEVFLRIGEPPAHGAVTISGDTMRFLPVDDHVGTVTFTYHAFDGDALSEPSVATIDLTNTVPTVGVTLNATDPATNDTITATAAGSDPDGDLLIYRFVWTVRGSEVLVQESSSHVSSLDLSAPGAGDVGDSIGISVTVSDGHSSTGPATSRAVVMNSLPVLSVGSGDGIEGSFVEVSGTVTDADGGALSITVDLGDQTRTTEPSGGAFSVTHRFVQDGVHPVTVTVTDPHGGTAQSIMNISIRNGSPSIGTPRLPEGVREGDTVVIRATASDPGALDQLVCSVDFGDGTAVAGTVEAGECVSPPHTYLDNGVFAVSVTVADDAGATNSALASLTVANVAPSIQDLAITGGSGSGCTTSDNVVEVSFTVTDVASDTADPIEGYIDWGDGIVVPLSGRTFGLSHTYGIGTFTMSIHVADGDDGSDEEQAVFAFTYSTSGILQPINPDGSSSFRVGKAIPVKIKVFDCFGEPVATLAPSIHLVRTGDPSGGTSEVQVSSTSDSGNTMRFDPTAGQYIFNLSTRNSQFNGGRDLFDGEYRLTIRDPAIEDVVATFSLSS